MTRSESAGRGPVKAWIEPDRWALLRAFPLRSLSLLGAASVAGALGYMLHPVFFVLTAFSLLRHAAAEASLRELFRDGMLHPAIAVQGGRGLLATLVRLEHEGKPQDAVVISRTPRRWTRGEPPWGGGRAAMVIAGNPPKLKPLSPDYAMPDVSRARRAMERIPELHWQALERALEQLESVQVGVHPVELDVTPWYGSVCDLEVEGSLPEHVAPDAPHRWCAGLAAVEEPTMVDAERAQVERRRRRAWLRALALLAMIAAGSAAVITIDMPMRVRLSFMYVGLFLVPLSLGWATNAYLRARAYGRDLRDGRLLRFAGVLSAFDSLGLDRDLALLSRRGVFTPEPGLAQDLSVLRASQELLHANGKWAPRGIALHVSEVAAPPEDVVKLALPSELRSDSHQTLDVGRRRFNLAELAELGAHAARMRKPGALLLLLTPFALSVLLVWGQHGWSLPAHLASAPLVLGLWLFAVQAFLRRLRFAGRLRRDVELGWVVTVDHDANDRSADPDLPACGVESLLYTRLDWNVNRRPASWRRLGR